MNSFLVALDFVFLSWCALLLPSYDDKRMYAEGCTIGCKACDGNGTRIPNIDHCPDERPAGFEPLHMPGALHPKYRSVNLNATPGSPEDIWYAPTRLPRVVV